MTTLEPEQKDILEKLNEVALGENWGTVDRVNGIPKGVAVIMEAIQEIKRLREQPKEILQELYNVAKRGIHEENKGYACACYELRDKVVAGAKQYGVEIDKNS